MYPGNPSYAGMGPRAIPEEWVRDDKVVHYLIPKTFVDWLTPKFGETGIYSLLTMGTLALASKVSLTGRCNWCQNVFRNTLFSTLKPRSPLNSLSLGPSSTCCLVTLSVKWLLINSPPHTTDFTPSRNTISKVKSKNNIFIFYNPFF